MRKRIYQPAITDAEVAAHMRDQVRQARDLLKGPPPDTFLGRKTYEPFPAEPGINLPYGTEDQSGFDGA